MTRLSRTVAWVGVSTTLTVLGPVGVDAASAAPAAVAAAHLAADPTTAPTLGSVPAADDGSTAGTDHGSMPGMSHGSAATTPVAGGQGAPETDHSPTSAAAHDHQETAPETDHSAETGAGHSQESPPVSRPLGWAVGSFVVLNGLVMAAAAVLRRRTTARRAPRRPRPAAA